MAPVKKITTGKADTARPEKGPVAAGKASRHPTKITPSNRPNFSHEVYVGCRVIGFDIGPHRPTGVQGPGTVTHYEKGDYYVHLDCNEDMLMELTDVLVGIAEYDKVYNVPPHLSRLHCNGGHPPAGKPFVSKQKRKIEYQRFNYVGPTSEQEVDGNPPFFVGKRMNKTRDGVLIQGYIDAQYKRVGGGYGPDTLWHVSIAPRPESNAKDGQDGHYMIRQNVRDST